MGKIPLTGVRASLQKIIGEVHLGQCSLVCPKGTRPREVLMFRRPFGLCVFGDCVVLSEQDVVFVIWCWWIFIGCVVWLYGKMVLKEVDRNPARVIFVTFISSLHRTMQRWYGNKLMTTNRAREKRLHLESNSQKKSLMTSVMSRLGSWRSWWMRLPNLSKKSLFLKTPNTKAERFWTSDLIHTEPFWNFLFQLG